MSIASRNPRTSLTDEDTQKAEEKALPAENAEEKMQEYGVRSTI